MALKLELAAARLKQAEAEVVRHEKVAQSFRQQYEEAADIIADMGTKYQAFEQGIQQNMEASPQSCIRIVSLSCMCSPARQKRNVQLGATTQTLQGRFAMSWHAITPTGS